ncbi:MAG: beta-ketoacyl synthase N-terminal-like domain-containing protein [Bacteroidales bacterium]|nr:beta-ketoacyl synthase N-terminal-like domain-containing protein [Bacteroidales bacterium]
MEGRVYISSSYMITSLGSGVQENFDAALQGQTGVHMCLDTMKSQNPVMAGIIDPAVFEELSEKYDGSCGFGSYTDAELLAINCVENVVGDAGLPERTGLVIASAKGNVAMLEGRCGAPKTQQVTDLQSELTTQGSKLPQCSENQSGASSRKASYPQHLQENRLNRVGEFFGIDESDVYYISNACISGVSALIFARRMILSGRYDNMIVVGVDVQNRFIISGFASFKSLSPELCRPYDASRCGLNLGEACGAVMLTKTGTSDLVAIDGGSASDDANHISGPSRTGDGLYFDMRDAMSEAGVGPADVDMLQMHGTATAYNDEMESKAAGLAGLSDVPAQSLKPYFGHTMGASGIIETILSAEELKRGIFLGVKGFEELGVPVPLNVSAENRLIKNPHHCLKTASGFGGTNAAVLLSFGTPAPASAKKTSSALNPVRRVQISQGQVNVDGTSVFVSSQTDFQTFSRESFKSRGESNMKFYKMDDFCKLGYLASAWLLDGIEYGEEECGIVMSGKYGCLDTDIRHQQIIDSEGDSSASPAVFVYTLPNVVAAEISIRHHIKGENIWFWSEDKTMSDIKKYASILAASRDLKYCIAAHIDFINGDYFAIFELLENTDR